MRLLQNLLLATTMLAGMGATALAQDTPLRIIYVAPSDTGNAFWLSVKKGMDDACALIEAQCQMLFISIGAAEQGQIANLQAAIAQQPDLIVTGITNDQVFDEVIKEAVDAGIPVIASNNDDSQGAQGNARLAFVGQSFRLAGEALADAAAKSFPAEGPIRVLIGVNAPAGNWSRTRADGVIAALERWKTAHPDRDISWEEIDAGLDNATVGDRVGNYLTAVPDLTTYLDTGFWDVGVVNVLRDRGVEPGEITIGGFDLVPDVMAQMKAGWIQYHVDQQPYLQGYIPVIQAPLMKKYGLAAFDVNTGSAIVTADQVEMIETLSQQGYR
jgi:simple sugar transport system substrate-binding protein